MKRIVLTGGGTAGHVTPNIALLPKLREMGYEIHYIGSYEGIEKRLIADYDIPYYGVSTGKLRRYIDPKNFSDPFRVLKGVGEAKKILKKIRPDIIFSKGGFVSVPVIRAARSLKIPCIIHESDMTPGLANRLCIPTAKKVCCNFPETVSKLPEGKAVLTGTPIRAELMQGNKEAAYTLCGFNKDLPVLMVIGGSTGSVAINKEIRASLPKLLKDFQVVHLCGAGNIDNLLIPLPASASRGDQILNAASFEAQGYSLVLSEEDMDTVSLTDRIYELYCNRKRYVENMSASSQVDAVNKIAALIEEVSSAK